MFWQQGLFRFGIVEATDAHQGHTTLRGHRMVPVDA